MTHYQSYNPESQHILWEGTPSDLASVASGGRINTAGYRLTTDALHFASGVLSNREENIPLWAIRDADIVQTMTQKARGVADLRLNLDPSAGGFGQQQVVLRSIRGARDVRQLIMRQANAVRQYWANHQHQRTVEAAQASAAQVSYNAAPQATAPVGAASDDFMKQLKQLSEMKSAGLLTDEEFATAKARLLSSR